MRQATTEGHGFLPAEGASDRSFESLAAYERYRSRFGDESGCILRYPSAS